MNDEDKKELIELHDMMYQYFAKVDIFSEKSELERLALKIVTDGMQIIGAILDKQ